MFSHSISRLTGCGCVATVMMQTYQDHNALSDWSIKWLKVLLNWNGCKRQNRFSSVKVVLVWVFFLFLHLWIPGTRRTSKIWNCNLASLLLLFPLCCFFFFFKSQRLNVFLVTQSVLTNREGKISFSDWPAPGIDFSNTIWPRRGGRKQSWATSSLRHVFLTLAALLRGRGELYVCTHPTARVDIMLRRFAQNFVNVGDEADFTLSVNCWIVCGGLILEVGLMWWWGWGSRHASSS